MTSSTGAGAIAAQAEDLKIKKYEHLDSDFLFFPVVVKTHGAFGPMARELSVGPGVSEKEINLDDGAYC